MAGDYRFIGKATPRRDAGDIVTGKARYLNDIKMADMLYGKVLRSPHPHAYIKRVNKNKALALPGVKAILTWEDVPDWRGGTPRYTRVLDRKVRFVGDAVALVAATSEQTAIDAVRLIEVEYEVLPAVLTMEEALKADAPQLYEEFPGNIVTPGMPFFGPKNLKEVVMGDVKKGFEEADAITEGTFGYENMPNPLPPEPPGAIALWEEPNNLTLWVSNQASYMDKIVLSHVTNKKVNVRTIGGPCGGSFGSKYMSWLVQCHAALLSRATGKPVKLIFTKEEHLAAFTTRPASRMSAKVGMKKDGTVTAVQGNWFIDTGNYSQTTQSQVAVGCGEVQIMVRCPNWDLKPVIVCTNRNASGIVRGFGGQELKCILIPLLSLAMQKLEIDPFEFLKKNYVKPGDGYFWRDGEWYTYRGVDYSKAMDQGAELFGWKKKWKGWLQPTAVDGLKRWGVGVGVHGNADIGEDASEAYVRLSPDGAVMLFCCVTEHGTGQRSNFAKMVAEVVQVPLDRVSVTPSDSLINPYEFGPAGSRGTYAIASAVIRAAEDARLRFFEVMAPILDSVPEDLETTDGYVFSRHNPEKRVPWRAMGVDRTVMGSGRFESDFTLTNCMMTFVEVVVDTGTGKVSLERIVKEACALLKRHAGKAVLNAGGTDLLSILKSESLLQYPDVLINIKTIPNLNGFAEVRSCLRIGALAKLSDIASSPLIRERYGILAEAAGSVSTPQIRNAGTIGGNLCQNVRCAYYRYPRHIGGPIVCLRKGGTVCNALMGDNRYHSIFGAVGPKSYSCASTCPANAAIPSYLARIRSGNFKEAARVLIDFNPLPAITGRVCSACCETKCKRGAFDAPVAIKCVERFLGDYMLENSRQVYVMPKAASRKKIAVVGSGPAGLSAAYYLRRAGHSVTVYEKLPEAGGMLFYCIPSYRLPKYVVKKQVEALRGMGIAFKLGVTVEREMLVEDLAGRSDAVLVAGGAWNERFPGIKGDAPILSGLEFLIRVNRGERTIPGKNVAVIGGGNVAIDVARTLLRLGARPVIIYRRSLREMPALKHEVEHAREEGVAFQFLTLPTLASHAGTKVSLKCIKMKLGAPDESGRRQPVPRPGSEFTAVFDAVIEAIGEDPDLAFLPSPFRKRAVKDASSHLLGKNIYRAGDFMTGASTVIEAVASGREAARLIHESLGGRAAAFAMEERGAGFTSPCYEPAPRAAPDDLPPSERQKNLDREDIGGITSDQAEKEAARCFNCGCVAVNPSDLGVALVALDGRIVTSKRNIDAASFFAPDATNPTILDGDEMVSHVEIPRMKGKTRQRFVKFTLSKPGDFAVVSVAAVITEEHGLCKDARIALGAVAPGPVRARKAEEVMVGRPVDERSAGEAAEQSILGARPLSKNAYKMEIAKTLVKRAILG